jgi:hypothetical protein
MMVYLLGLPGGASRIQFAAVCCLLSIQSTTAWSYLDQDEDIWWVSLLAFGVLVVIFVVTYCAKEVDRYISPIHPYIPRDGLYIAEYREPDGIGKRNVYLTFDGDEEKGWTILHQEKGKMGSTSDKLKRLVVTGGFVDPSGKMWWREEGPGTEVESYGRYDLSRGIFAGTWVATHTARNRTSSRTKDVDEYPKDSILATPSKGLNVRRVKYTSFYHAESFPETVKKPVSRYGKSKDLSKFAADYTAMGDDYVNVTGPDGDVDEVIMARNEMTKRNPSSKYTSKLLVARGDSDPPVYSSKHRSRAGQTAARIFGKFDESATAERSPSPDPDYIKVDDTMSIAPLGNDDATLNSDFAPNLRQDNTFQTNQSFT